MASWPKFSFVGWCLVVSREILCKEMHCFHTLIDKKGTGNWMQWVTYTKANPVLLGPVIEGKNSVTGISVKYYRRQSPATKSCSGTWARNSMREWDNNGLRGPFCCIVDTVLWNFPPLFEGVTQIIQVTKSHFSYQIICVKGWVSPATLVPNAEGGFLEIAMRGSSNLLTQTFYLFGWSLILWRCVNLHNLSKWHPVAALRA